MNSETPEPELNVEAEIEILVPKDHLEKRVTNHSEEDEVTKLLVGFANDLLAYENRMERTGSTTLFIHDYVAKRHKRMLALIQQVSDQRVRELATATVNLNRELDIYWNSGGSERPPSLAQQKRITVAQGQCAAVLSTYLTHKEQTQ